MSHKIIIDTDPGIDDAMAIFFAFQSPDLDVLGLTTVFGNVPVEMAACNALALCELADKDIPVTRGVARPWIGKESTYAHFVHGDDGFGNINHMLPTINLDPRSSAQFIIDTARKYPGEVTIVAIAPLGNLALALRLEPELPKLIKAVYLMGGAANVPGNVTPVGEANIWNDPHAAEIVFSAAWDIKMFGLDVTYDVSFPPDFVNILAEKNKILGDFVARSSQFYMDFYSENKDTRRCFFHDAFPLAYLINPDLFEMTKGNIRIATDYLCRGQTIFSPVGGTTSPLWTNSKLVDVATKVNHPALTDLLINTYAL